MIEGLTETFERVHITPDRTPSRREARRARIESGFHMCAVCLEAQDTNREFIAHVKGEHRAVAHDITAKYKAAVIAYKENPSPANLHNMQLGLLKVTMLQKVFGRKIWKNKPAL